MLRFTKKTEYALLCLQFIALKDGLLVPAKEIADSLGISFEIIAKVLHSLSKAQLVKSFQGAQGGYTLAIKSSDITLESIIKAIEGSQAKIVECSTESGLKHTSDCSCSVFTHCTIKHPMSIIQQRIDQLLQSITIQDFLHNQELHTIMTPLHNDLYIQGVK